MFVRDLNNYPGSNQVFIVFDSFVAVFDPSGIVQAKHLMKEIRARTDKPIRYVINSHFHPDHSAGAAVFAAAGTDSPFIGLTQPRSPSSGRCSLPRVP